MTGTELVDNALVHVLLDVAKIAAALVGIGLLLAGIDRLCGRRPSTLMRDTYRRAVTEPRDERRAQAVHRVMAPELRDLRKEMTDGLTAVKDETRGVIEAHTVDEMAGVREQIEVAKRQADRLERIEGVAAEALKLGQANSRKLDRFADAVGVTIEE